MTTEEDVTHPTVETPDTDCSPPSPVIHITKSTSFSPPHGKDNAPCTPNTDNSGPDEPNIHLADNRCSTTTTDDSNTSTTGDSNTSMTGDSQPVTSDEPDTNYTHDSSNASNTPTDGSCCHGDCVPMSHFNTVTKALQSEISALQASLQQLRQTFNIEIDALCAKSGSSQKDSLKRPVSKPSESDSVDTDVELPSDFCAEHQSPVVSQSEGTDSDRVAVSEKGSESEDEGLHSEPATERKIFFSYVLEELQRCSSFVEVQLLAEQKEMIERFCLPVPSISNPVGSITDRQTWLLLEPEVRHRCFPLRVEGDGNCLFRSLSLLLFGDEKHHVEMRCRIVMEMAGNPKLFLDGRSWCGPHDRVSPEEIILVAKATSVSSSPSLETAFQEEVMAVKQPGTFAGLWELFAACQVTKCALQSVHPSVGYPLYRLHCNRIMRPHSAHPDHKLFIMWSSTHDDGTSGDNWLPNHFVPLLLRSPNETFPKRHVFYQIQWHGSAHVGEVLETDELLQLCCVRYLESSKKDGQKVYFWIHDPEVSWEPFTKHNNTFILTAALFQFLYFNCFCFNQQFWFQHVR
ncbi:uncharacterized protein LOC143289286 [Babylonia areolata]|uniref:uncharacterized protein LOC143289286 n=1 Tax=Babylonia areolata TaxID=304850 RepID=UPI003FD30B9E